MRLVIVRRGSFAIFERLTRTLADDPGTRLIWDRRRADRRQTAEAVDTERRLENRRRAKASVWSPDNYLVVNVPEAAAALSELACRSSWS